MQIYNPNDYPIYHLLPPMIESETEMSKSPASLIEDMLKRIQALEDGGSTASAEWGKITGNLSNQTDLNAKLNTKADKTSLDLKADKTELTAKADKTYVDASLESKVNRSELTSYATKTDLADGLSTKADKTDLANKVDKTYVDSGLALKADKTALEAKADKTYVDSALETKADKSDIANNVDKSYVDSGLALKADKTYVDNGLSTKADKTALDTKADNFTVDGKTILMTDQRVIYAANSGDAVNKEYVDTQDALRTKHTDFNLKEDVALPVMGYSRTQGSIVDYMKIDLTEIVKAVLPKLGRTTVKVSASYYDSATIIAGSKTYRIDQDLVHISTDTAGSDTVDRVDFEIYKKADFMSPAFSIARVIITIYRYTGEKVQYRTSASQLNSVPMAFSNFTENEQENTIVLDTAEYDWKNHWYTVLGDTIITVGAPNYFPFSGPGICKTVIKSGSTRTLIAQSGGKMWKGEWAIDSSYGNGFTNSRKNVVWTEITL